MVPRLLRTCVGTVVWLALDFRSMPLGRRVPLMMPVLRVWPRPTRTSQTQHAKSARTSHAHHTHAISDVNAHIFGNIDVIATRQPS